MKRRSARGTRALVLCPLILAAALLTVGLCKTLLVLEIGRPGFLVPVSEGDVFFRTYVHSMYRAPVTEKFRVEGGHFRLVHVMSQSDAVLEYLGLERKDEPNVDRQFTQFTIPAASIGNHMIRLHDRDIPLGTHEDTDGKIRVKLMRVSLLEYVARLVWR